MTFGDKKIIFLKKISKNIEMIQTLMIESEPTVHKAKHLIVILEEKKINDRFELNKKKSINNNLVTVSTNSNFFLSFTSCSLRTYSEDA